jgi:hypothetical protein
MRAWVPRDANLFSPHSGANEATSPERGAVTWPHAQVTCRWESIGELARS